MTTQEILADFILETSATTVDQVPMERAKAAIVDCVGVALAGSVTPLAKSLDAYLRVSGDISFTGHSLLIGNAARSSAGSAALRNGTVAHALDFDDDSHPGNAHYSANLLPALLSVWDEKELFSDDFRCSHLIGFEVAAKLGRVLQRDKRGPAWHPTGVLGPVGCAAAVSKALSLSRGQIVHALGIAASCGTGLRANFGTMTKPLHSGRSAQAGVMAALLAREGYESSPDVFDGPTGYFRAFGISSKEQIALDVHESLSHLGDPWEICTDVGLQIKPYPACAGTHPGIEAALAIEKKIDYHDIESIYVGTCSAAPALLTYRLPEEGLHGKFSMEYCVALALKSGAVTIDAFSDEQVRDPEIRALISRMNVEVDDRVRDSTEHAAVVSVVLKSGVIVEELVEIAKGKGHRWMSIDDQRAKFEDTAGRVLGSRRALELFAIISGEFPNGEVNVVDYLTGEV